MPNWCSNVLDIKGSPKDLAKIKELVKGKNIHKLKGQGRIFDFNKIIPYPQEYLDKDDAAARLTHLMQQKALTKEETKEAIMIKLKYNYGNDKGFYQDGYNSGGYDWCCRNWGTKWNAGDTCFSQKGGRLTYDFDTAWCSPMPVILKLSKMFPKCDINLLASYEGGEDDEEFTIKNGLILDVVKTRNPGCEGL